MLEQFRILAAALRLREFGTADLARESGVAEGTVQKTLYRRKDLFIAEKGAPTGRRGGQTKHYRVNEDALRGAIQREVDELELPDPDDDLGAALAEDTMCRILPRARKDEREPVLAGVGEQLFVGGRRSSATDALYELYSALRYLVQMERWFAKGADISGRLGWIVNAILSAEEAEHRRKSPEHLQQTAARLRALPHDALHLASFMGVLEPKAKPAPIDRWWLVVPAAVWTVLRSDFWRDLAGDLTQPTLLLASGNSPGLPVQPTKPVVITPPGDPLPRAAYHIIQTEDRPRERWSERVRLRGVNFRYNPLKGDEEYPIVGLSHILPSDVHDYAHIAGGLTRIGADYSRSDPLYAINDAHKGFFGQGPTSVIESFDFHFSLRRVVGCTIRPNTASQFGSDAPVAAESSWIQFGELRFFGDRSSLVPKGFGSDLRAFHEPPLPPHFSDHISLLARHNGIFLKSPSQRILQVRLNPGHAISVYENAILNSQSLEEEAKSGEVWWLDFSMDTGQIVAAHMHQMSGGNLMIPIPFDDLRYDPHRQGFVLTKVPGLSEEPNIAAAIAMGKIEPRPDLH